MSDIKVIVPETTTNRILNPQFYTNITDGWTAGEDGAGGAWAWDNTTRWIGRASAKITAGNDLTYLTSDTIALANGATLYAQVRGYAATAADKELIIYDSTTPAVRATTAGATADDWELLQATWTNSTGGAVDIVLILYNVANDSAAVVWFDAVQAEIGTTDYTTYCDGTQAGCAWNGAEHNSTATRSGASRAGGVVQDLYDDYGFSVIGVIGWGATQRAVSMDGYAGQPGGALNNSVRVPRIATLTGELHGTSLADFRDKRNALIALFNPEAFPKTADGWQPVTLRDTSGTTDKEIKVHLEAGLRGERNWQMPFGERMALRFFSPDPNFYAIGNAAQVLDTNDTATLRYIGGRLKSTGQWDDLGLTADPTVGGAIYAICVARDRSIYIGGGFTDLDGVANRDYIARYLPSTESWETVVGDNDVNALVYVLSEGPDGKIYAGGTFTNVDGIAAADYIAVHDPAADTWAAVGIPVAGTAAITDIRAMAWDSEGNLYIGGDFTRFADVANADYIAKWDGASWSAVGSGGTGTVYAIAIDENDNIFIGGDFTNWNADGNADYWAWYEQDAAAWAAVDDIALSDQVRGLAFDELGQLFVCGYFTAAAGVAAASYIFAWTGTAVEALGTSGDAAVTKIAFSPDGHLWAGGTFTTIGGINAVRLAIWNGNTWMSTDIVHGAFPITFGGIAFSEADADIVENYDVYIGASESGVAHFSGATTVTNAGTVPAYPQITIKRSGGVFSVRVVAIRNETTGKTIACDYSLVDGETLTIDTHPDRQTVVSSFYGARPGGVLPGSDLGEFMLLPGANNITIFVALLDAPTITAYLQWQTGYDGVDD